jgi:cubilin
VCGGVISNSSGLIRPPMTGQNYTHQSVCTWNFQSPNGMSREMTITFKAERIFLESSSTTGQCIYDYLKFVGGESSHSAILNYRDFQDLFSGPEDDVLSSYCGRTTSPLLFSSPFPGTKAIFKTDETISDIGFNVTYSYSECGGVFIGPNVNASTPKEPGSINYPLNTDCVWLLKFEEGEQIEVQCTVSHEKNGTCCRIYFSQGLCRSI